VTGHRLAGDQAGHDHVGDDESPLVVLQGSRDGVHRSPLPQPWNEPHRTTRRVASTVVPT